MSVSPERRRFLYGIDRGIRTSRIKQARRARGSQTFVRVMRDSWSISEMCGVLGVSERTLRRFEHMGIVPKTTYPSYFRRYWQHQAVQLIWLFESMRMEGWPKRMPHFVGSRYWTLALTRLRTEWKRKPYANYGEAGGRYDHDE